jgi:pre-mRNA-processing factor 6
VSPEEWQNIPEVGDARNRKKRLAGLREKYTPISDRILSNSLGKRSLCTGTG